MWLLKRLTLLAVAVPLIKYLCSRECISSNYHLLFQGDLNGHRGLVPSNFLQAVPDDAPVQPAPEPKKESQVALKLWAMA